MRKEHKEFLEKLLGCFEPKHSELVHVTRSLGRVLASDVRAKYTSPHVDIAAVDGYALFLNGHQTPDSHTLKIIGESSAGDPFAEEISEDQTVRVYAGARLPINANTVIPLHEVDEKSGTITVHGQLLKEQNICFTGVDFMRNEPVLKSGYVMTARDIGLAASMLVSWLPVCRKPNIAVISIGDELIMPDDISEEEKLASSSSLILCSFIEACGGVALNLGIASDTETSIERLMESTDGIDLFVTTGGMSHSDDKLLKKTLDKKAKPIETTVNLSNETHVLLGAKNGVPVLALPGNPISAHICATLFLRPIINKMTNMQQTFYKKSFAILDRNLDVNDKQMDYIFARLTETQDKRLKALPASSYDRILMSALAQSDCLITVSKEHHKKGDHVDITRFMGSWVSG